MLKKITPVLLLVLQGCTQLHTEMALNKPLDPQLNNQIKLPAGLRTNMFRTSPMEMDEDQWDDQAVKVTPITFDQLTDIEKSIYIGIEHNFLDEWVQCNGKEFLYSGQNGPYAYFYEIMNYQPRVELDSLNLTNEDIAQNIQWKGNIRMGIYKSMARDIVPNKKYTFLSEYPEQSLPNFQSSFVFKNAYFKDDQLHYQGKRGSRAYIFKLTKNQFDCKKVNAVLETTR